MKQVKNKKIELYREHIFNAEIFQKWRIKYLRLIKKLNSKYYRQAREHKSK